MTTWKEFEQAEPDFAADVRVLFDAGRHKTIATLRADGSPRISGIECEFTDDHLCFGSMTGARKGADLGRDPRLRPSWSDVPSRGWQRARMAGGSEDRRTSDSCGPGGPGRGG